MHLPTPKLYYNPLRNFIMALFLESTLLQESDDNNYIDYLFEALEVQRELTELNEAIYQADFVIHQKSQTLTESARILTEANFLTNVWAKVKAWLIKAWAAIKGFAAKIKAKIVEIYNRVKDRVKGDSLEVSKSSWQTLNDTISFNETMNKLTAKLGKVENKAIVDSIKAEVEKAKKAFDEKKAKNSKLEGKVTVSFTQYTKIVDLAGQTAKVVETAAAETNSRIKELEGKVSILRDTIATVNKAKNAAEDKHNEQTAGLQAQIEALKAAALVSQTIVHTQGAATAAAAAAVHPASSTNDTPNQAKSAYEASIKQASDAVSKTKKNPNPDEIVNFSAKK